VTHRERFDKARAAVLVARKAHDDRRRALEFKYGGTTTWASTGERRSLERLRAGMDRADARIFKLLEKAPRDWTRGVPSYWVAECLTYDDAFRPTSEPLSVEPPRAYGY